MLATLAFVVTFAVGELVPVQDYNVSRIWETDGKHWLLMFTQSHRQDLSQMQSDFVSASLEAKTQLMNYVLIDCEANSTYCDSKNITSYPSFYYVYSGVEREYVWERTFAGFYSFGHKLSNPAIYNLQRPAVFQNFKKYEFSYLLWYYPFSLDASHLAKADLFEKLATEYHHSQVYFGRAVEKTLREMEGIKFSDLPIVKRYGNDEVFDFNVTNFDETSLRNFVERHKWGVMPAVNASLWREIWKDVKEKNQVLVVVIHAGSNYSHYAQFVYNLKMVQWALRRDNDFRFQMASLDIEKYPDLANLYQVTEAPVVLSIDWRQDLKLGYGYFNPEEKGVALRFLEAVWLGKSLPRRIAKEDSPHVKLPTNFPQITTVETTILVLVLATLSWCCCQHWTNRKTQGKRSTTK